MSSFRSPCPLNSTVRCLTGLALSAVLFQTPVHAQTQGEDADAPRSAIDWLSQSIRTPAGGAEGSATPAASNPVAGEDNSAGLEGVTEDDIVTTPLGRISKDAVGLFPPAISGLPSTLWGDSQTAVIAELIAAQPIDALPAIRKLLYTILLSELEPPADAAQAPQTLLLARLDKLLELGALEPAQSLIERAGPDEPEIFRRWFDVSLLTDHADRACAALRATPDLAPTMPARIFCLARNGDWNAAVVTLETGETLGFLEPRESDLIARFLDPELFENPSDIAPPDRLTPLEFEMREAIGAPRPSAHLPLAFYQADISGRSGLRKQLLAAEQLASTGAIDPAQLIAIYSEGRPAASGGLWDRMAAIQAFDIALLAGDRGALAAALEPALAAMHQVGLEEPFARFYSDRIIDIPFPEEQRMAAMKLVLLSDAYERAGAVFTPETDMERFLLEIAAGMVTSAPDGALNQAIGAAFMQPMDAPEFQTMLDENRLGEVILRAMLLLDDGGRSDPVQVRRALSVLRRVGLEDEARRAALQMLLLDLRG